MAIFLYQVSKQCLANRDHKNLIYKSNTFENLCTLRNILVSFTQLQLHYKEKFCLLSSSSSFKLNKNMDWFFIGPIYTLLKSFVSVVCNLQNSIMKAKQGTSISLPVATVWQHTKKCLRGIRAKAKALRKRIATTVYVYQEDAWSLLCTRGKC